MDHVDGGRVSKAVTVLLYLLPDDRAMACVMEKQWRGPLRIDRRLSKTVPIRDVTSSPRGVPSDLWLAYQFLGQVIWDHVDAQRERDAR